MTSSKASNQCHGSDYQQSFRQLLPLRRQLIQAAKYRAQPIKSKTIKDLRSGPTLYEQAKEAETTHRELLRAAHLYTEAAKNGEKIDSCLKDFASIVHQMGQTGLAVSFLRQARKFYEGDLVKFDRLILTLNKQINPSGKHQTKHILVELPQPIQPTEETLRNIFTNTSRIKSASVYNCLNFAHLSHQNQGRWLLLQFESFSGAKKTLEKFNLAECFGYNLYWVREGRIVCVATDGREDFEGMLVDDQAVKQAFCNGRLWWSELRQGSGWQAVADDRVSQIGSLAVWNRIAIRLLELDVLRQSSRGREEGGSRNLVHCD